MDKLQGLDDENNIRLKHKYSKPKRNYEKFIVVFVIISITVVAVFLLYYFFIYKKQQVTKARPCAKDTTLIEESLKILKGSSVEDVKSLQKRIESIKYYNQDVNCLFILTESAVFYSDSDVASKYYSEMKSKYSKDNQFVEPIKSTGLTIENIGPVVEFLKQQNENSQNTKILGPRP